MGTQPCSLRAGEEAEGRRDGGTTDRGRPRRVQTRTYNYADRAKSLGEELKEGIQERQSVTVTRTQAYIWGDS